MTNTPAQDQNGHGGGAVATVHRVTIDGESGGFSCRSDQTVIEAMRAAGRSDLSYGCRGGGCGVCRVEVKAGDYASLPMSTACVSPDQQKAGLVLACRIRPRGDLTLVPAPLHRAGRVESRAA